MVVLFISDDGACAVELFGEDETYELVREDEVGEAEDEIGSGFHFF